MGHPARIAYPTLTALAVALSLSACSPINAHRGMVLDPLLSSSIAPGVDNRESVERMLGRPTFVGQFAPDQWYYVSRSTKQLAFAVPKPSQQTVLRVTFDQAGNVANVERAGMEQVADINPNGDKTPTMGRERSFFEELFGNIGSVGVPGTGGATPPN